MINILVRKFHVIRRNKRYYCVNADVHPVSFYADADDIEILVLIEVEWHRTTLEITDIIEIIQSKVVKQLRQFELVSKADGPNGEVMEENLISRISSCD